MTTYKTFSGTSPSIDKLPRPFRDAIYASQAKLSNPVWDRIVGSAASGTGYCSSTEFRQQLYCACVNAPTADPECVFAACANYGSAYKTTEMQSVLQDASKNCPDIVNCTQIVEMGGSGNIASGVRQTLNCGGVVKNIITALGSHSVIAVIFIVLVLLLVIALGPDDNNDAQKLLPPELVFS